MPSKGDTLSQSLFPAEILASFTHLLLNCWHKTTTIALHISVILLQPFS